jgi:hypothetical protein
VDPDDHRQFGGVGEIGREDIQEQAIFIVVGIGGGLKPTLFG